MAGNSGIEVGMGRRRFLTTTAAGVGAMATMRSSLAAPAAGANDKVRMAIIGSGGMGRHHMNTFKKYNVDWAGVCDIYKPNLAEGMKIAGDNAKAYHDYKKMLDSKDFDAILIATPEHWHHRNLLDVLSAGFDCYCEKPMCHSIAEGKEMVKAVAKTDRIVQVGMQRRSSPLIQKIKKEVFDTGELGDIHMVRANWFWNWKIEDKTIDPATIDWERFCGPAGPQEWDPLKLAYWRWYWPFSGGNEADQGTHLMDVVQWMLNEHRPIAATQSGGVYVNKPSETPDNFACTIEYPKTLVTWTLTYTSNTYRNGWAIVFHGTKKSLMLNEAGYRVFENVNGWEAGMQKAAREELPGGVTSTEPHTKNFLECIKSRKQPNATVQIGHEGVRPLHLANAALMAGSRATLGVDGVTILT